MVVSVTASTTQGSPLQPDQLTRIEEACQMAIELHEMRITMLTYVESRMSFIAPNISILVGASTAAKLMGKTLVLALIKMGRHLFKERLVTGTVECTIRILLNSNGVVKDTNQ